MPRLGPVTVECDAPPYYIVTSCDQVGIDNPADVRWSRMMHFLNMRLSWREYLRRHPWKTLFRGGETDERHCTCGAELPRLEQCTFTLNTGEELIYYLGQCRRCRTVFWEEP
jgi:hypothetical protein